MIHLGDITKINGANAPVADCIIGGSPCQDLSIAGKRAGLAGERSGLYMDQIRIVKEMRAHDKASGRPDRDVRPRYMVWENVPGAFSSNKGRDFAAVIEEAVRVIESQAPAVPVPEKGWPTAGVVVGDGWSIAWRVLDAQFWGVPQRRRRIALVADYGGRSAPEILFERSGLQRDTDPSQEAGKEATGTIGGSSPKASYAIKKSVTSGGGNDQTVFVLQGNGIDRAETAGCNGKGWRTDVCYTLNTIDRPAIASGGANGCGSENLLVCGVDGYNAAYTGDVSSMLCARGGAQVQQLQSVRRLTPLECERLQGFPDGWTDIGTWYDSKGKKRETSDAVRYKALGNSIALPPWKWVLKRICAQYERDATMASLFDGIGGFPLLWEQLNGEGSCLWASEIEEFPMAVTNFRFARKGNQI